MLIIKELSSKSLIQIFQPFTNMFYIFMIILFNIFVRIKGQKVHMQTSKYGFLGGNAWFHCNFTESDDSIIGIDWFFSADPSDIGVPILSVDPWTRSVQINNKWNERIEFNDPNSNTSFTLNNLQKGDQGIYRCTVIGDNTVTREEYLEVYDPPKEKEGLKVIEEFKPLAVGESVIYTCQSANSKPATILIWSLNDVLVNNDLIKLNLTLTDPETGTSTSVLKILLVGAADLNGVKISCKAVLPNQSVKEWSNTLQITREIYRPKEYNTVRNIWKGFIESQPIKKLIISAIKTTTIFPSTPLTLAYTFVEKTIILKKDEKSAFLNKINPYRPPEYGNQFYKSRKQQYKHNKIYYDKSNRYNCPCLYTQGNINLKHDLIKVASSTMSALMPEEENSKSMYNIVSPIIKSDVTNKVNPFKYSIFPLSPLRTNMIPKYNLNQTNVVTHGSTSSVPGSNIQSQKEITPAVHSNVTNMSDMIMSSSLSSVSPTPTAVPGHAVTNSFIPLAEGDSPNNITKPPISESINGQVMENTSSLTAILPAGSVIEGSEGITLLPINETATIIMSNSETLVRNKSIADLNLMLATGGPRDISVTAPMRSDMTSGQMTKPNSGFASFNNGMNQLVYIVTLVYFISSIII